MKRLAFTLLVCAACVSCTIKPGELRRPTLGDSRIAIYLQPLPTDAARLRFRIESVSAIHADGATTPLSVHLGEVRGAELARERLLARGPLAAGAYVGLAVEISGAALAGSSGDIPLLAAEQPARMDIPFTVTRRGAVVISARLHFRESLVDGVRFAPELSATVPVRPPVRLTGMATSCGSDTLTVFDKKTGRVAAVVPAGRSPRGVVLDPIRLRAYVALEDEDAVEVIDLQQYRSIDRVELFGGDRPVELAMTPDGRTLLVVNRGSDSLSLIELGTLSERNRVSVGDEPVSILVDAAGRRSYVFNTRSNSVSVIDVETARAVATISTEPEPLRGQLDRQGTRLYVIHGASPYLTVVDPMTLEIVNRVYVGSDAAALKIDSRTDRIYLAHRNGIAIDIYDPLSLLPVDSIPIDVDVAHMTIDDEGNTLSVALHDAGEVRILDLVSKQTAAVVDVADEPCWTAFLGER